MKLLEVNDLRTYFFTRHGVVKAVDGVSFHLDESESLGLVGESGCGKSVTCLSITRLLSYPGRIMGGEVLFKGQNILRVPERMMRNIRGKRISIIFQDPLASLNPVMQIGTQISEGPMLDGISRHQALQVAQSLLALFRFPTPQVYFSRYPHQLSGGMRQRICAAISLGRGSSILIADEPTTSLDATIQLQFLNHLRAVQREKKLGIIFVTHDFDLVAKMCDRACVMYAGRIVETADVTTLFNNPAHPYTKALIKGVPKIDKRLERLFTLRGQPPSLDRLPPGCSFEPRCDERKEVCLKERPSEVLLNGEHQVACWQYVRS